MDDILKIYVIEDHKTRRDGIKEYFQSVNRLLKGEKYQKEEDFRDCHVCFKKIGYKYIEIKEILPDEKSNDRSNYLFEKKAEWVKEIDQIIKTNEKRIFLIDFVLNDEERNFFRDSENAFRAKTAKSIVNYINSKTKSKEYIIFESVINDLVDRTREILDIGMGEKFENVYYTCLLGYYFQSNDAIEEKIGAITASFEDVMKEMQND